MAEKQTLLLGRLRDRRYVFFDELDAEADGNLTTLIGLARRPNDSRLRS